MPKEKGLEPLADVSFWQQNDEPTADRRQQRRTCLRKKALQTAKEAIDGARDIIAEQISDEADYRIYIRNADL